jgi:membrane peptidoglycan carboxypeptidase
MAGYTAQLVAVVWMGKPDPGPIRDAANQPIQGDGLPASIWRGFLTEALRGQPGDPLPAQGPTALVRSDSVVPDAPATGYVQVIPTPKATPTQTEKPTATKAR